MQKNVTGPKILPNQADIQALLPTHELVTISTKFHKDYFKIVHYLIKTYFWASNIFWHQSLFRISGRI